MNGRKPRSHPILIHHLHIRATLSSMNNNTGAPDDWPENVPWYKWPPFPAKPEGVEVIPFSQFVATGLWIDPDDETSKPEGVGAPTVELESRHDGEKKKRRRKKKTVDGQTVEVPLEWWEEIEEDSKSSRRAYKYDHRETYVDRLLQARKDFMEKRRFPTHVQQVAQVFAICLGLVDPSPQGIKTNPKAGPGDDDDDDDVSDDDESELAAEGDTLPSATIEEVPENEGSRIVPETARERALDAFHQDPERVVKLFLTSYAYDKGVYWNEHKIRDTPILVEVFLNFLENNEVFTSAEKGTRHGIARAKKVVQLAKQEMPHTTKLARLFPDAWGKACGLIWGQRIEGGWIFGRLPEETRVEDAAPMDVDTKPDPSNPDDPSALKPLVPTEAELLADAIEPPSINGHQTEWSNTGGWGAADGWGPGIGDSGETWEKADGEEPAWGQGVGESTWNVEEFMAPPEEDPAIIWGNIGPSGKEQLEAIIGPNNLPDTYVTLRVEASSRIIDAVVEPTPNPNPPPAGTTPTFGDIAQQRLARLTLLPSPQSQHAPMSGACVNKPVMLSPPVDDAKFGWVGPHDPLSDNITVLIQPDEVFLEALRFGKGMVVSGTFVQVAELPAAAKDEDAPEASQPTEGEPPKKKKKKKGKKDPTAGGRSWWFFYQIGQVYPTFLTE
ncbi:hypothetical protein FRC08_000165 [Ceratobasidium sp. 394]|nr:hypothetical protein FRC08_000165 [Ceratobasidium sp. 394]